MNLAARHLRKDLPEWGLAAFCILFGLVGLRLGNNSELWERLTASGEASVHMGSFRKDGGGVRHRIGESLTWHDMVDPTKEVFGGDSIFTGPEGRGEIVFDDGSSVEVLPNSLIRIPSPKNAAGGWDWFRGLGRSLVSGRAPEKSKIVVLQGQVQVKRLASGTEPEIVGQDKAAPVSQPGAPPAPAFEALSPAGDQIVQIQNEGVEIPLSWKGSVRGSGENDVVEWIALETGAVAPEKVQIPADQEFFSWNARAGKFRWRVTNSRDQSEWATFQVQLADAPPPPPPQAEVKLASEPPPAPPKPEPKAEETLKIETLPTLEAQSGKSGTRTEDYDNLDRLSVVLRWKKLDEAVRYRVKVYDAGKKVFKQGTVGKAQFELVLRSLRTTHYKYRVEADLKSGKTILGPLSPIEIQISAPLLKIPQDGHRFESGKGEKLLTWVRTVLTDSYDIQISTSPKFSDVALGEETRANYFALPENFPSGRYFWRVRGSANGRKSPWSETRSFWP